MKYSFLLLIYLLTVFSLDAQQEATLNKFLDYSNSRTSLKEVTTQSYRDKVFVLDQQMLSQKGGISFLQEKLILSSENSFLISRTSPIGNNPNQTTVIYQHLYDGVPVEGSGYTSILEGDVFDIFAKATSTGPPGPGPCSHLRLVDFYISDVSSGNITGTTQEVPLSEDLSKIADEFNISTSDLSYQPLLKWSTSLEKYEYVNEMFVFYKNEFKHIGYFSATQGFVKTISWRGISGETLYYNTVDLDDSFTDGAHRLTTSDGRLSTYDVTSLEFSRLICLEPGPNCDNGVLGVDFFIPETTLVEWPVSSDLDRHVLQTHYASSRVLEEFDDLRASLNLNPFQDVNIAAADKGRTGANFFSNPNSSLVTVHYDGFSRAVYDILGHEMTHIHLGRILPFADDNSNTLHEALASMVGVYIESKISGSIDWKEGDDIPDKPVNLDIEDLPFECYTPEILALEDEYVRRAPLLHWFYLLVNGEPTSNISALGIDLTTNILLNGADLLPRRPESLEDFSDLVLAHTSMEYGLCSDEYRSVLNAFNAICLTDYTPTCNFLVNGPRSWCEEYTPGRPLSWNIPNPFSEATYYWTFPFEWQISGNRQGNTHEGPFLTVTDIPAYSSYPVTFKLYVYSPQLGANYRQEFTVRLNDCDRDNPPGCKEGKSAVENGNSSQRELLISKEDLISNNTRVDFSYHYYDISGRKLHSSKYDSDNINFRLKSSLPTGIYFVVQLDSKGKHVSTKKKIVRR